MEKSPRIGPWRANRDLNQLEFDGQPHRLRPRTMDLLIYMAERSGQVLSVSDASMKRSSISRERAP